MRQEWLELERELDAALAKYAAVEPREGLEKRVLANLRAQDARAPRFEWRHWVAAGFVVTSLAALAIWFGERHSAPLNPGSQPAQHEVASRSAQVLAPAATEMSSERKGTNQRTRRSYLTRRNARGSADSVPKLAQFPAPQPLTEQEKLLIRFVEEDPQDAALTAQATAERLQQETDEMKAANSSAE